MQNIMNSVAPTLAHIVTSIFFVPSLRCGVR